MDGDIFRFQRLDSFLEGSEVDPIYFVLYGHALYVSERELGAVESSYFTFKFLDLVTCILVIDLTPSYHGTDDTHCFQLLTSSPSKRSFYLRADHEREQRRFFNCIQWWNYIERHSPFVLLPHGIARLDALSPE